MKTFAKRKRAKANPMWKELLKRRFIGGLLSNVAFNLPQKHQMTERDREVLTELRKKWDAIKAVK
jgi:hypothetical protein